MSQPKTIAICTLGIFVVFGCTSVAISQELHPKLSQASGLAKVRVAHIEKIQNIARLPPNACDPLNNGETVVVSLEIIESSGYVQKKIYVELPWGKEGSVRAPLIASDTIAVGNSYWIVFTKLFAGDGEIPPNPRGVAGIWAEVDGKTERLFERTVEEDRLKAQYEYAPHLTDIGFAKEDPVGEAEKQFPTIDYLNRELERLAKQQLTEDQHYEAMLNSMNLVLTNPRGNGDYAQLKPLGKTQPDLAEEKRKRVDFLKEQYRKKTEFRNEHVEQLKALNKKFNSEIVDFEKLDYEVAEKLDLRLSSLSYERPETSWHVEAARNGKRLWKLEVKGRTQAPSGLANAYMNLPTQSNWLEYIANPQDMRTWPDDHIFETGYEFKQPAPNSLCSVCSWEPDSFTQYFLNATTGGKFIVVRYEIQASKSGPEVSPEIDL